MSRLLPEAFQPHVGLSAVFASEDTAVPMLPEDSRLQPIDAGVEAQLRAMLQAQTFDAVILQALRPQVYDRAVLAPAAFHALRERAIERLEARLHPEQEGANPDLRAALTLLRARSREHELGESFRYALLKG